MTLSIEHARSHLESLCRGLLGAGLTPWVLARVLTGVAQDACALEREAGAARRFQMGTPMQQSVTDEKEWQVKVKELSTDIDDREPDPGCVLGDKCVNPHLYHLSYECATAEMMEAWARECEEDDHA